MSTLLPICQICHKTVSPAQTAVYVHSVRNGDIKIHLECSPDSHAQQIYFPRAWEKHDPIIIWVVGRWDDDYKGNPIKEELLDGRVAFYPVRRCVEYTVERWERIQCLLTEKAEIENKLDKIMKERTKS
jgi:hypothetical protein